MRVEHRSTNPNHQTPDVILAAVRKVEPIALDPCTTQDNPTNALAFFAPEDGYNGLEEDWLTQSEGGLIYMNPPYGRNKGLRCKEWVDKALLEASRGAEIIMLLPSRTDTSWFQQVLEEASAVCFIRGRLVFKGQVNGAPFPSAVISLTADVPGKRFERAFMPLGHVVSL